MFPANHLTLGPQLVKALRARLVLEGSSLEKWAGENSVKRQNLCKALEGEWKGPKAQQLVQKAIAFIRDAGE